MSITTLYTSASCNRTPDSLDWGDDGLIYFAANNAIAVFDPKYHGSVKIVRTLTGHTARVNTVRVVHNASDCLGGIDLISGSDDSTCILWNTKDASVPLANARFVLKGHTNSVTVAEAFVDTTHNLIVATGSVDSSIKLWHAENETEFACFQTIDLRSGLTFGMKLFGLPQSNATVLAYTTDTDVVNLCVRQEEGDSFPIFVHVEQLKGHCDWVRGLDHIRLPDSEDCLLASSSQDTFIRLWRISPRASLQKQKQIDEILLDEDITLEERTFTVRTASGSEYHYALSLESVLQGHEGWVYGVHFRIRDNQLHLLSSSIDKTLTVWTPSESGVWVESVRVGEVGGSSLGFYGGKLSPDGRSIIGHGFQGSFHLWHEDPAQPGLWNPGTIIGGHFGGARDLAWDPTGGMYVMTLSADQTTRVHAPWLRGDEVTWHEIGRPQVHGYDMQCLTLLSRYRLASAAEEKIIRIFEAPSNFVQNFRTLCGISDDSEGDEIVKSQPMGASVPSLGLSNKAVFEIEQPETETRHIKDMYPEHYFSPITMSSPPAEETLMQNTLWPEVQKLYGHGNEIYAIACTYDGSLIASACRATSADQAQIILWDTNTWRIVQQLTAHQLTVTQLAFSPNGQFLLSVSRDRTFSVFHRVAVEQERKEFKLFMRSDKSKGVHTRIIWCCDWSHDSETFVTGSRDGKVVAWTKSQEQSSGSATHFIQKAILELKNESITAVAFGRMMLSEKRYLVAVGLESGAIKLYTLGQWDLQLTIAEKDAHHMTVKRLSFRPHVANHQLASCGEDGLVRVYAIEV